jgi:hypothetical protein
MSEPVLHLSDFAPLLNGVFSLHVDEGVTVSAELVDAKMLTGVFSLDDSPREPFALLFRLEEGAQLAQRMYDVAHGDSVWRQMFLVPVSVRQQGHFVEAVFN